MKVQIKRMVNRVRMNFWFIPGMIALSAALAGYLSQRVDAALYGVSDWQLTDPAGARAILTTVASSSITVAGVIFSITMVVLSSASTQYGPRLLQAFIRQPQTKWVLGGYIGIFIYCLMVTATIRDGEGGWVPQYSVTAGGVLGVLSFALLILFIHHVTVFLQAPRVVDEVSVRLHQTLETLYPLSALPQEKHGAIRAGTLPSGLDEQHDIVSQKKGYIQAVKLASLLEKATKHDALIKLRYKPGSYIVPGEKIATFWCASGPWKTVSEDVHEAILLGPDRTDDQDAEFAIDQLVEVAVRALSPGINDPFTAINCIELLGAALVDIDERGIPSGMIHDDDGQLRLVTPAYSFRGFAKAAFNQIRQNASGVESVSIALISTLARLRECMRDEAHRLEIDRHAALLKEDVEKNISNPSDREDFMDRYAPFEESH